MSDDENSLLWSRQYEITGTDARLQIGDFKIWIKQGTNATIYKGGVLGYFNIIAGENELTNIRIKHECILKVTNYLGEDLGTINTKDDGITPLEQEFWIEIKPDGRIYVDRLWACHSFIRSRDNKFKFGDHWFNVSMIGKEKLIYTDRYTNPLKHVNK